jgi:hypothetical protein
MRMPYRPIYAHNEKIPEYESGHILDDAVVLKRATVRYHARKGNTG